MKALCLFFLPLVFGLGISEKWKKKSFGGRIIGGEVARASQFPFVAAINANYGTGSLFCGGSIIGNQWILTSAFCIKGSIQSTIRMGSNNLEGSDPNRVTVVTSTYAIHPDYNPETLEHDIALIRLRLPIQFNEFMSSINLPRIPLADDTTVTAVGWGQLGDFDSNLASELRFVQLVTISNNHCKSFYGEQILDDMVCVVGQTNEGTCTGDSGGPLIEYRNERAAVHVAVATFVSGDGCEGVLPSGFTRTYPYINWITEVTGIEA